jgi:chromosome segregation ATPase
MSPADLTSPVTRGELQEALAPLQQQVSAIEDKLTPLQRQISQLEVNLGLWGGGLLARIESGEKRMLDRIESGEKRMLDRIEARIEASEQRLLKELGRHISAAFEAVSAQISAIDEKYADLPARVRRLEVAP